MIYADQPRSTCSVRRGGGKAYGPSLWHEKKLKYLFFLSCERSSGSKRLIDWMRAKGVAHEYVCTLHLLNF